MRWKDDRKRMDSKDDSKNGERHLFFCIIFLVVFAILSKKNVFAVVHCGN